MLDPMEGRKDIKKTNINIYTCHEKNPVIDLAF
jgi:hypothetical protein